MDAAVHAANFRTLVETHQEYVRNTCYRFLNNREDAENVAQEVFIQVHDSMKDFRNEAQISTWVYRIAVNKSLDFIRKKKRKKRFGQVVSLFGFSHDEESLDEFVEAVSRSAYRTNNQVFTRQMAQHSRSRVKELREWGFFDSALCCNAFSKPIAERSISVQERIVITHLIKDGECIAGAAGFSLDDETVHFFCTKSVILCTGARGFKPDGFPICDLTHDGTVMAYDIGTKVTGKEWNDGHPGQSENAAACYDGWRGMFEKVPGTTGIGVRVSSCSSKDASLIFSNYHAQRNFVIRLVTLCPLD